MKTLMTALAAILVLSIPAYSQQQGTGSGMMGGQQGQMGTMEHGQMMGAGQSSKPQEGSNQTTGASIFMNNCARCHPGGGNNVDPDLPLRGSDKLANFKTFLAFIRNPKMPDGSTGAMPAFSTSSITDKAARELYHYIVSSGGRGMTGGYGYGMGSGMMGGYGMGSGMMGDYGMGPGMMGGYHGYSPECQKFYDESHDLRKQLHDKRFQYFEVVRNPKATGETADQLRKEIGDLQNKIYAKAPLGCMW
jgi:mono/diheme cytochrome c family protein